MIPSAVFVSNVALQTEFQLSSKISKILGACQKRVHMFGPPRESK